MQPHLRKVLWAMALFCAGTNQLQVMAASYQSAEPSTALQLFLTTFTAGDSPAVLHEGELSALVDKKPTQVKAVHFAKDDPLLFAVLVDISGSDAARADSVKEAAFELFNNLTHDQSQGYLVLFNHRVAASRETVSASQAKEDLDAVRFGGGTAVYDAIEQTCKQMLSRSRNLDKPRRVILVISDGEDNQSHVTHTKAEEAAIEEGVSIFSIVTKSSLGGPRDESFLKDASQRTGGFATNKDLKQAVFLSLAAIEAQWAITLAPTQSADGKLHSLQIKSTRKDVHISAPSKVLLQ
jgi:Ca-activated chloride channel homolog